MNTRIPALMAAAFCLFSCSKHEIVTPTPEPVTDSEYMIEITSADDTKSTAATVNLNLADLTMTSSKTVTAQLKKKSGTSWATVTSGVTYSWSATSTDSQKFSGSGTTGQACTVSAKAEGSGTITVSASLSGSTVATQGVPVVVSDSRAITWTDATTTITSNVVKTATLNCNFSGTVTVSSNNSSFLVGTNSGALSSTTSAVFSSGTTKTIYYEYTGSEETTVKIYTSPDAESDLVITVKKSSGTLESVTIEEASEDHILFPGESVNLHAVGHYSDGTTAYISDQVTWIKAGAFGTSTLTVNGDYATFTAGTPSGSDHTSGNIFCQYIRSGQSPLMSDYCPIKIDAPSGIAFYDIDTNLPTGESKTIYVKKTYYYSEFEKIAASSLSFDAEGNSMFTISGNTIRANDCSTAQAAILGVGVLTVHGSFTENGQTFSSDTTYSIKRYKYVTYVNGEGNLNQTFYLTVHYHDGTTSTTTNYQWKRQTDSSWSSGPLVPTEALTYMFQYSDIVKGATKGTRSWAVNIYYR